MKADIWARSEETLEPAVAAGEARDAGDVAAGVGVVVGRTAPALVAPSVAAGEAGDPGTLPGSWERLWEEQRQRSWPGPPRQLSSHPTCRGDERGETVRRQRSCQRRPGQRAPTRGSLTQG